MLIGKKVKWENLLDDIDKNTPSKVELTSLSTTYQNLGTNNKADNSKVIRLQQINQVTMKQNQVRKVIVMEIKQIMI